MKTGKSRPNRFASVIRVGSVAVVLDPDVARLFKSSESVNDLFRCVISALPGNDQPKKRRVS